MTYRVKEIQRQLPTIEVEDANGSITIVPGGETLTQWVVVREDGSVVYTPLNHPP